MKQDSLNLLKQLINIDSQNPPGNERTIILFIKEYLKRLGVASRIYEFKKNRLNLVCTLPSRHSKKRLLFTPHVDTVPYGSGWKFHPLKATLYRGKLYGRGATDCKVNVAAALSLIQLMKKNNLVLNNIDLDFAFCADEETGSHYGTVPLVKYLKHVDYGVVLDANEFNIIVAQKGLLHLRIEINGKEAHGAYPERGINAVDAAVDILKDLRDSGIPYQPHPLLKKPTLNVGKFVGGDKVNIVPGYAFFELDIRYLPSQNKDSILKRIKKIAMKHTEHFKIKILAHQKPIEIDPRLPTIVALKAVLKKQGIPFKLCPSFGATVINFLHDAGIKTFAFGFGSKGCAHIKNEYVRVNNLFKAIPLLRDYVVKLDTVFNETNPAQKPLK